MSRVTTYLNFDGTAEEAFNFYASVFGTSIDGQIFRVGDMPPPPGTPELSDDEKRRVGHAQLPILGGHVLMASDIIPSMGHQLRIGNNVTINLEPDTREEADRLYAALSAGGSDSSGLAEMPWAYWGTTLDKYDVRWMFNVYGEAT
jgi:PhnB protein